jgi:membrane-associated phospholipid phosphatase
VTPAAVSRAARLGALAAAAALLLARAPAAHAQEKEYSPGAEYLYDGGAIPFFWGALAGRLAIDVWLRPPPKPRWLFHGDVVGLPEADWELPGWVVTATGGAVATGILLGDDDARWNHAKGLAQTLATGAVLTAALKVTFGRHRPDYQGAGRGRFGGESRSFLSGHSVQAFEIATYSVLYLRAYGLEGSSRWMRGAAFAGIYAGAALVAAERVLHHRHHLSDVIAGSLLGTALAVAFYTYQESRLDDDDELRDELGPEAAGRGGRLRDPPPITAQWLWSF